MWSSFEKPDNWSTIALGAVSIFLGYLLVKKAYSTALSHTENAPSRTTCENLVELYVFPCSQNVISASPASSKIQLYCRMAGIPHKLRPAEIGKNPKGKVPYILHDNKLIGDSELIIRYFENSYDLNRMSVCNAVKPFSVNKVPKFIPYPDLSLEQQAVSDLVRVTCESDLYWTLISTRWMGEWGVTKSEDNWNTTKRLYFGAIPALIRWALVPFIRAKTLRDAYAVGLARHSPDDQIYLARRLFKGLSTQLGDKDYFLGDIVSNVDAAAYAILENFICTAATWPNPFTEFLTNECPNLSAYVARLRSTFFEDFTDGSIYLTERIQGEIIMKM